MTSSKRKHTARQDILAFLPLLFQSSDVGKLTGAPHVFLHRAKERGEISAIIKGYYINTWKGAITGKTPSIEQIACFVRRPSYISCEWALNAGNVLDQAPTVCTVITLAPSVGRRSRIQLGQVGIEYSKIKESLFWGYEFTNDAYLATTEKAILDTVYLRGKLPVVDELNWDFVDLIKVKKLLDKYPRSVQRYMETVVKVLEA